MPQSSRKDKDCGADAFLYVKKTEKTKQKNIYKRKTKNMYLSTKKKENYGIFF